MAEQKRGTSEIEEISDEQARRQLKEIYADGEAAERFFDEMIKARSTALDRFAEEVNGDERLTERFMREPLGLLNERKLLGPLDRITIEGLRNPFFDFPWPWPYCRIVCRLEPVFETHWVCVGFWPLRFCWPVFHVHLRWKCRIVCD
jgi:hypothetical protein